MEKKFNQKDYINKYKKEHYKQFKCDLPIELNNQLEQKLKELHMTKKQFLLNSIEDILKK